MNMTYGALSRAMLAAAGDEIQAELSKVASTCDVKPGSVFVTKGYGLKCKHVLHVVCYSRKHGSSVQVLCLIRERTLCCIGNHTGL